MHNTYFPKKEKLGVRQCLADAYVWYSLEYNYVTKMCNITIKNHYKTKA